MDEKLCHFNSDQDMDAENTCRRNVYEHSWRRKKCCKIEKFQGFKNFKFYWDGDFSKPVRLVWVNKEASKQPNLHYQLLQTKRSSSPQQNGLCQEPDIQTIKFGDVLSLVYLCSWLSFVTFINEVLKFIPLFSFNQKASTLFALRMLHKAIKTW